MRVAFCVSLLVLTARCATMVNGPYEEIPVRSEPAGAHIAVDCGTAPREGGQTPARVRVQRAATMCSIVLSKEGFEDHQVEFRRQASRASIANEVPGVVVGAITAATAFVLAADSGVIDPFDASQAAYHGGHELGAGPANAIDRRSGSAYKQVPGQIFVRLHKVGEPSAVPAGSTR